VTLWNITKSRSVIKTIVIMTTTYGLNSLVVHFDVGDHDICEGNVNKE